MVGQGSGAAETTILQRGGEELLLSKVDDRFTTRLSNPEAIATLQAILNPLAVRPVARGQLVEWRVNPAELEASFVAARDQSTVLFASHVYQLIASPGTWIYLMDQLTVQFAPAVSTNRRRAIAEALGLVEEQALAGVHNTYIYLVTPQARENPIKLANRLMALPEVLAAEPNVAIETAPLYRPTDGLYQQQWHLTANTGSNVRADAHISVEQAWDMTRGSRSIVIAISDDGFDLNHPDLQGLGKLVAPTDLQASDAVPLPMTTPENHGTACAGLALGEENRNGIVGVAPGCGFMPIRTTGFLDDYSISRIFQWAVEKGAAVISCSWSSAAINFPLSILQSNALTQAATKGRDGKGCVIVFSAGNANRPISGAVVERNWPQNVVTGKTEWLNGFAVHPDVIAVSACTSLNGKAAYSNWGKHVAVTAPSNNAPPSMTLPKVGTVKTGPEVKRSLPGRGMVTSDRVGPSGYSRDAYTFTFGGTSSSCPEVAGVAGLMLSANPNLTAREVKQILEQTADKIVDTTPDPQLGLQLGTYGTGGHSQWFGYGRVNAYKAVLEAKRRLWSGRTYTRMTELEDSVPTDIPDNVPAGITRSLQCRDRGVVQDLYVQVELEHMFWGDVTIHLQPPSGKALLLRGRQVSDRQTLSERYDLSTTPVLVGAIGREASGRWQLRVSDHAAGHTGQLLSWRLVLALQ